MDQPRLGTDHSNSSGNRSIVDLEGFRGSHGSDSGTVALQVLIVLLFSSGAVLNAILVAVFVRRRGFRKHMSHRFLFNLVIINLVSMVFYSPLLLFDTLLLQSSSSSSTQWSGELTATLCLVNRSVSSIVATVSVLAQLLIGLDQHLAVMDPLHYHRKITRIRCLVLCLVSWIVGIFIALIHIAFVLPNSVFRACEPQTALASGHDADHHQLNDHIVSSSSFFLFGFLAPFVAMVVIYVRVFCAARNNSIRTRRNSSCSGTFDAVTFNNNSMQTATISSQNKNFLTPTSTPVLVRRRHRSVSGETSGSGFVQQLRTSMQSKISCASSLMVYHREEGRAATVTLVVLVACCICWLPYHLDNLFNDLGLSISLAWPLWLRSAPLIMASANATVSPLLYAFRSIRIRREVRKALGCASPNKSRRPLIIRKLTNAATTSPTNKSVRRLKSFSCPQLMVSSEAEASSSGINPSVNQDVSSVHHAAAAESSSGIITSSSIRIRKPHFQAWRRPFRPPRCRRPVREATSVPTVPESSEMAPMMNQSRKNQSIFYLSRNPPPIGVI